MHYFALSRQHGISLFIHIFCFLCLPFFAATANNFNSVRVFKFNTVNDASYDYFIDVLQLALDKGSPKQHFSIEQITTEDNIRDGWGRFLTEGYIDVIWAGTNKEREQIAQPIRIPLLGGLLGYRTAIINRDKINHFADITKADLQQLLACQKATWPDADILQFNGFKLARVSQFELMFKMVAHQRCDYFPRAIFETQPELSRAQQLYPNLTYFDDVIIHYPFPMYFFVAQNNHALAKIISQGLKLAIADGSLRQLRQNHPITRDLFPLSKWQDKTIIKLTNPFLPELTPLDNPSLWLQLEP